MVSARRESDRTIVRSYFCQAKCHIETRISLNSRGNCLQHPQTRYVFIRDTRSCSSLIPPCCHNQCISRAHTAIRGAPFNRAVCSGLLPSTVDHVLDMEAFRRTAAVCFCFANRQHVIELAVILRQQSLLRRRISAFGRLYYRCSR